jgi:hypothetical protein
VGAVTTALCSHRPLDPFFSDSVSQLVRFLRTRLVVAGSALLSQAQAQAQGELVGPRRWLQYPPSL